MQCLNRGALLNLALLGSTSMIQTECLVLLHVPINVLALQRSQSINQIIRLCFVEVVIAPFGADEKDLDRYYEFILIWDDPSNPLGVSMQRMFTSSDDPGAKLPVLSAQLYSRITNLEFDTEITHDVKKMLIDYLKRNK